MNLRNINLNLLLVFEAMAAERSTTKAGHVLGISQSAVSNSLAQLRSTFDDPLFVRVKNVMVPTPKALELARPIHEALQLFRSAVGNGKPFDPATDSCAFRIGMADYCAFLLLGTIAKHVRKEAKNVKLRVRNVAADNFERVLDDDEVDLCIGFYEGSEGKHQSELLFWDDWVAASAGHRGPLDIETYLNANHIVVGDRMCNHIDRILKEQNLVRCNVVSLPFCLAAPVLVEDTDLMLTLPRRLARAFLEERQIGISELPFPTDGFPVQMTWHTRVDADLKLKWLRSLVSSLLSERETASSA